jgi:secreted trypsin-like serine protease
MDTCFGDSGGPLLVVEYDERNQGHFVASGIVSYGNRQCDASISSGVYTRVGFYLPWIQSILSNI